MFLPKKQINKLYSSKSHIMRLPTKTSLNHTSATQPPTTAPYHLSATLPFQSHDSDTPTNYSKHSFAPLSKKQQYRGAEQSIPATSFGIHSKPIQRNNVSQNSTRSVQLNHSQIFSKTKSLRIDAKISSNSVHTEPEPLNIDAKMSSKSVVPKRNPLRIDARISSKSGHQRTDSLKIDAKMSSKSVCFKKNPLKVDAKMSSKSVFLKKNPLKIDAKIYSKSGYQKTDSLKIDAKMSSKSVFFKRTPLRINARISSKSGHQRTDSLKIDAKMPSKSFLPKRNPLGYDAKISSMSGHQRPESRKIDDIMSSKSVLPERNPLRLKAKTLSKSALPKRNLLKIDDKISSMSGHQRPESQKIDDRMSSKSVLRERNPLRLNAKMSSKSVLPNRNLLKIDAKISSVSGHQRPESQKIDDRMSSKSVLPERNPLRLNAKMSSKSVLPKRNLLRIDAMMSSKSTHLEREPQRIAAEMSLKSNHFKRDSRRKDFIISSKSVQSKKTCEEVDGTRNDFETRVFNNLEDEKRKYKQSIKESVKSVFFQSEDDKDTAHSPFETAELKNKECDGKETPLGFPCTFNLSQSDDSQTSDRSGKVLPSTLLNHYEEMMAFQKEKQKIYQESHHREKEFSCSEPGSSKAINNSDLHDESTALFCSNNVLCNGNGILMEGKRKDLDVNQYYEYPEATLASSETQHHSTFYSFSSSSSSLFKKCQTQPCSSEVRDDVKEPNGVSCNAQTISRMNYAGRVKGPRRAIEKIFEPKSFFFTHEKYKVVIDSHHHIGEWMLPVDLAVAEKALVETNNNEVDSCINVAAKSLGRLSLVAGEAAAIAATPLHQDLEQHSFTNQLSGTEASTPISIKELGTSCVKEMGSNLLTDAKEQTETELKPRDSRLSLITTPWDTPIPHLAEKIRRNSFVARDPSERVSGALSSSTLASVLVRAPKRHTIQGRSKLLRGIALHDVQDVINAVSVYGADPNDYCLLPTKHVPWTVFAPALFTFEQNFEERSMSKPGRVNQARIRLHPLHLAATISSPQVVKALLQLGACPNALDEWCRNPLHVLLQPPPLAFHLVPETLHVRDTDFYHPETVDLWCQLFIFLLQQASPRCAAAETQIAECLCEAGLNINFQDKWNRHCVDYATVWCHVRRMIQHKFFHTTLCFKLKDTLNHMEDIQQKCRDGSLNLHKNHCTKTLESIKNMSIDSLQKHLSLRIPERLLDFVHLQEDRLRLYVLRSFVGVRAGGGQLPKDTVKIHLRPSLFPQHNPIRKSSTAANHLTPLRESHMDSTNHSVHITHPEDVPYSNTTSVETHTEIHNTSATPNTLVASTWNSKDLSHLPCTLGHRTSVSYSPDIEPLSVLRLSCLRALKSAHSASTPSPLQKCVTNSGSDDIWSKTFHEHFMDKDSYDIALFLRLWSLPSYRYHPAFSGVWEYLGATLFPNNSTNNLRHSLQHSLEDQRDAESSSIFPKSETSDLPTYASPLLELPSSTLAP